MGFNELKKIRFSKGEIFSFNDYKIYMIPSNKLGLGISPVIDKFINKEILLSDNCKSEKGRSINEKYIQNILTKKNAILFFLTKTIKFNKDRWVDEPFNNSLIRKIESMDLTGNTNFFNKVRTQLSLRPLMKMMLNRNPEKYRGETIDAIRKQIDSLKTNEGIHTKKSKLKKRKSRSSGGHFVEDTEHVENLISFMFIEKKSIKDYYINVVCTTKLFSFDPNYRSLEEYKFPWGTFFLYIFVKSLGEQHLNLYNDSSNKSVIFYHKRFLFNLGKKMCGNSDELYDKSLAIPFDVVRGPNDSSKRLLSELIDSLPDDYGTKSGYRMKVCDIQNSVNIAKINDVERYLSNKWDATFKLSRLFVTKTLLRSSSSPKSPRKRSMSLSKKTNKTESIKKSVKLKRRHSYNL